MKPALGWLLVGSGLLWIAGCGKDEEAPAFKGPVTVEQAASVLDLSKFPLMDGAKPPWPRGVASLSYEAPGDVTSVFEFQRKKLAAQGWKELPNSSLTEQAASAMFAHKGFVVSVSIFPREPKTMSIFIQNHGNIQPGKLPRPPGVKPVYVGDASAMYVTDAAVAATADACRKLLLADSWIAYGSAGDSGYYKQNAIRIEVTVSSAPAQCGKTMISYSSELMSADLPAPPDAAEVRYSEQSRELSFETAADHNAVIDFYKKTLAKSAWQPTLEHMVTIDDKEEMIFRNAAKDMLTLAMPPARDGKQSVSLQHQSAAEITELDREIKEHAPEIRAKLKKQQEDEQGRK
jgi:Trp operon repressor